MESSLCDKRLLDRDASLVAVTVEGVNLDVRYAKNLKSMIPFITAYFMEDILQKK